MAEKETLKVTKSIDSFLDDDKSSLLNKKTSSDSGLLDAKRTTSSDGSLVIKRPLPIVETEPVFKKNVIKAEKWPTMNPARLYPMQSSPRGLALIINNEKFDDENSYRFGSAVDAKNLERLLTQLDFKVTLKNNLSKVAMMDQIRKFSRNPGHQAADMCIFTVLSHGKENDEIFCTDGSTIKTDWIFAQFNNVNCKALVGKPKLFILQACRGNEKDYGITRKEKKEDDDFRYDNSNEKEECGARGAKLLASDMLIVYSTVPGYTSLRDHDHGTWLIQCITDVFAENAKDTDIRDMLDMVSQKLANMEVENGNVNTGKVMSCTYKVKFFPKKLYFNPGLRPDKK